MNDLDATDPTSGRKRTIRSRWWVLSCLIVIIVLSVPWMNQGESIDSNDARPIVVKSEGFASSSSCRECHPNEHRSWHASYHRTMTQVVNAETAPQAIRNQSVTVEGELYRFEQAGDRFFVTLADPLVHGESRRREIVMMTGSHHMHVFWYASDFKRTPGQLNIVYLKDEQRWIPRRSAFLKPPDMISGHELGRWNQTCCQCHSTHPRMRLDVESRVWDTHVVEFGIACEACHGQGGEHVRRHSSKSKDSADGDRIIHPLTVSHRASADVCGQCHRIAFQDFEVLPEDEYLRHGNPFVPGQLLANSAFNKIVQASPAHRDSDTFQRIPPQEIRDAFWSDGMPRASGREYNGLIESPCYQRGEMTCLSCHTMHPEQGQSLETWRDDQLKPGMRGDQACLQCHAQYADRITEHTHHAAGSHGSRCLNCHMPHTTYGLLKTIRSHQISSPSVMTSVTTGRPSGCTLCHLDRSFAWISSHLHDWYDQPELKIEEGSESATTSAAVLHLLRGDAAQRAIQASAFGWQPAREVSGTDWMEPLLLLGMNDPYDAIRIIAERSLATIPGKETVDFDTNATWQERLAVIDAAINNIERNVRFEANPEVLIDATGAFDFSRARELIKQRNHRPINILE